jgi:hypothetical protein
MTIEHSEMAAIATGKSYRRLADWIIALVLVAVAAITAAAFLVRATGPRDEASSASFSAEAASQSRAMNEPVLGAEAASTTFNYSAVVASRGLNEVVDPFITAVGHTRALNEFEATPALSLTGIEEGRALNTPATSLRFMPGGPGR